MVGRLCLIMIVVRVIAVASNRVFQENSHGFGGGSFFMEKWNLDGFQLGMLGKWG